MERKVTVGAKIPASKKKVLEAIACRKGLTLSHLLRIAIDQLIAVNCDRAETTVNVQLTGLSIKCDMELCPNLCESGKNGKPRDARPNQEEVTGS